MIFSTIISSLRIKLKQKHLKIISNYHVPPFPVHVQIKYDNEFGRHSSETMQGLRSSVLDRTFSLVCTVLVRYYLQSPNNSV